MDQMATDIGSRLKRAREQRGLSLRDIANTTKISTAALIAIERNDFARLPGGVFTRAYLRVYATEVGLDADELTRAYRASFETEIPTVPLPPHKVDWYDAVRPHYRLAAVVVTVGVILIGGWVILDRGPGPDASLDQQPALNAIEAGLLDDTAPTDESDVTDVGLANAAVTETSAQSLRLEIRPNGPCWVSAVADGERVIYRLLHSGERTVVEARSAITLRVGDAGTFAYSINGATGRPLGRNGEAVTVRITHDSLERLYAEPESAIPKGAATRIGPGPGRGFKAKGARAIAT
jgi:cytoskeletal protein RodZ